MEGFESLEQSLSKNEEKEKMFNRAVEKYIENGWAYPLTKRIPAQCETCLLPATPCCLPTRETKHST